MPSGADTEQPRPAQTAPGDADGVAGQLLARREMDARIHACNAERSDQENGAGAGADPIELYQTHETHHAQESDPYDPRDPPDAHDHTALPHSPGGSSAGAWRQSPTPWLAAFLSLIVHVGAIGAGLLIVQLSGSAYLPLVQEGSVDGDTALGDGAPLGAPMQVPAAEAPPAAGPPAIASPAAPAAGAVVDEMPDVTPAEPPHPPPLPPVALETPSEADADEPPPVDLSLRPDPMAIRPAFQSRLPKIPPEPPEPETPPTRPTEVAAADPTPAARPESPNTDPVRSSDAAPRPDVPNPAGEAAEATGETGNAGADPPNAEYPHEWQTGYAAPRPAGRSGAGRRLGRGLDTRGLPIPDYPQESRLRREEGLVVVEVDILPDGTVQDVKLVSGPGHSRLHNAAIHAARRGDFAAATYRGQPIRGRLQVSFRFVLR